MRLSKPVLTIVVFAILPWAGSSFSQDSKSNTGFKKTLTIAEPDTISEFGKFYTRLTDIAVGKGKLYVVDNVEHFVRVFDARTGEELSHFGRKGNGPGEFQSLDRIRYFAGRGIVLFDGILRRLSVFWEDGSLVSVHQLKDRIEDFIFVNDTVIVASTFLLKKDHKPVHFLSLRSGEFLKDFGSVSEPQDGIFETIEKSGTKRYDAFPGRTRLVSLGKGSTIVFGQRNPYKTVLIDLSNGAEKPITKPASFETESNNTFEAGRTGSSRYMRLGSGPSGGMCGLESSGDRVAAIVMSKDLHEGFVDYFDPSGKLERRISLPSSSYSSLTVCDAAVFDEEGSLYLLMHDFRDFICWIDKYSPTGSEK